MKRSLTKLLDERSVYRRRFSIGMAATALMAGTPGLLLGQTAAPEQEKKAPVPAKRPPIQDPDPFVEPLVFTRQELKLQVRPFPLNKVVLEAGLSKMPASGIALTCLEFRLTGCCITFALPRGYPLRRSHSVVGKLRIRS